MNKPKSTVKLELLSESPSVVGSPKFVNVIGFDWMICVVPTVVPLSSPFTLSSGSIAGSLGPFAFPLIPVDEIYPVGAVI